MSVIKEERQPICVCVRGCVCVCVCDVCGNGVGRWGWGNNLVWLSFVVNNQFIKYDIIL